MVRMRYPEAKSIIFPVPPLEDMLSDKLKLIYMSENLSMEINPNRNATFLIQDSIYYKPGPVIVKQYHKMHHVFGCTNVDDFVWELSYHRYQKNGPAWEIKCHYKQGNMYTGVIVIFGMELKPLLINKSWQIVYSTIFPHLFGTLLTKIFSNNSTIWRRL